MGPDLTIKDVDLIVNRLLMAGIVRPSLVHITIQSVMKFRMMDLSLDLRTVMIKLTDQERHVWKIVQEFT